MMAKRIWKKHILGQGEEHSSKLSISELEFFKNEKVVAGG